MKDFFGLKLCIVSYFVLFMSIGCNPFDLFHSAAWDAKNATVSSVPSPGIITQGTDVIFTTSSGAYKFSLFINATECQWDKVRLNCKDAQDTNCTAMNPYSTNPCDRCRAVPTSKGKLSMACTIVTNSTVDYQITAGGPESVATGKKKSLGIFTVQLRP